MKNRNGFYRNAIALLLLAGSLLNNATMANAQSSRGDSRRLKMEPATSKTKTTQSAQTDATTEPKPRLVVQLGHNESIDSAAFSADGNYIVTGCWGEGVAIVWDARTGTEIRRFAGNKREGAQDGFMAVTFSPDNSRIAATSESGVRIFDIATGKLVRRFRVVTDYAIMDVSFSKDGSQLSSYGHTWEVATGKLLRRIPRKPEEEEALKPVTSPDKQITVEIADSTSDQPANQSDNNEIDYEELIVKESSSGREIKRLKVPGSQIRVLAISPDASLVVTGSDDLEPIIRVLDVNSGNEIAQLQQYARPGVTNFSRDGLFTTTSRNLGVTLREVLSGSEQTFGNPTQSGKITGTSFSDNRQVIGFSTEQAATFLNTATSQTLLRIEDEKLEAVVNAISPDGTFAVLESNPRELEGEYLTRLWNLNTRKELITLERGTNLSPAVAFSPDSQLMATGLDSEIALVRTDTGKEWRRLKVREMHIWSLAFSLDGQYLAATSSYLSSIGDPSNARVWKLSTGQEVLRLKGHPTWVQGVAWSPDGQQIATSGYDGTVRLWDFATGKEIRRMKGHTDPVIKVQFSADGRFILSLSDDNTERLCRVDDGSLVARIVNLTNGDWVVIDNEGRFDTNNLDSIRGLHWVMPDDPLKPLPLEIFMRSYYEPRLLARLIAGEKMRSVQNILRLNRAQPEVRITKIAPQSQPDQVSVTVEVGNTSAAFKRDGQMVKVDSGVYDLRLFRDGQLVAYAPEQDGAVTLDASGKAVFTFKNIRLPDYATLRNVEFSAYAFNADRVKSNTSRMPFLATHDVPIVKGRAYVITIGVNAYENAALNLQFAANDAHRLQNLLTQRLQTVRSFSDVVGVSLIADYEMQLNGRAIKSDAASAEEKKAGRTVVTSTAATKANVRLLLDALAGRSVDSAQLAAIPGAEKLQPARPEDLVIISFAGHGYADSSGSFYLVPYDIGAGEKREVNAAMLQRCISSEELSRWLRNVDAGEMIMIIDACQSAAAVEGKDFKPGPMGSRGLGQLSYDKGMRILTATQSDNVALENKLTRQGLLTYALVHDGIEMERADFKPQDKIVTLSEWLKYGVWRVPELYVEIKSGQINQAGANTQTRLIVVDSSQPDAARLLKHDKAAAPGKTSVTEAQTQQPSLFDFSRKKRDVTLLKK